MIITLGMEVTYQFLKMVKTLHHGYQAKTKFAQNHFLSTENHLVFLNKKHKEKTAMFTGSWVHLFILVIMMLGEISHLQVLRRLISISFSIDIDLTPISSQIFVLGCR